MGPWRVIVHIERDIRLAFDVNDFLAMLRILPAVGREVLVRVVESLDVERLRP